jgi:hypothetical protein
MDSVQAICVKIAEEASEVAQAADKIVFYGPDNINPVDGLSGLAKLVDELNDLEAALGLLREELGEAAFTALNLRTPDAVAAKRAKILKNFEPAVAAGRIVLTPAQAAG